jgi:lipoprotein-anchoring transpeptidase ErfK/SrfK
MLTKYSTGAVVILTAIVFAFSSCNPADKKPDVVKFEYKAFKDSISKLRYDTTGDAGNIFDSSAFTPGRDSLNSLLVKMDTLWRRDAAIMLADTFIKTMKKGEHFTPEEIATANENLAVLDSFLKQQPDTSKILCRGADCPLYAEIIKSSQTLFLYIAGELVDSFKVSTGMKKYETPPLNLRPSGPLFTKYKSKKYPGGNYMGLGNMPYVVFLRGGYAIHGTTPGNFKKLGTKASHGCIRLHPYNARIFYELVKKIGLKYTWVSLKDSLK